MSFDLFFSAYSTTSQVMFPILVLIIILLIRDLAKYSKISEKIQSFSHSEDNIKENTEIKNLEKKLNNLIHPTKNYNLEKVPIDSTFPDFILNNINNLNEWIIK